MFGIIMLITDRSILEKALLMLVFIFMNCCRHDYQVPLAAGWHHTHTPMFPKLWDICMYLTYLLLNMISPQLYISKDSVYKRFDLSHPQAPHQVTVVCTPASFANLNW